MDALRWILLILGVVVLAGIYVAGRMRAANRRPRDLMDEAVERDGLEQIHIRADGERELPKVRGHDDLDALNDLDALRARVVEEGRERPAAPVKVRAPAVASERPAPGSAAKPRQDAPQVAPKTPAALPDKLIVLHVTAGASGHILGVELKSALESEDLEFGFMDIYHRQVSTEQGRTPQFSVANMLNPGTFDPAAMDHFSTVGISLFLQLPGPRDGLESFDTMLSCAESLAKRLNGHVLDASRSALTPQGIEHIREVIREWSHKSRMTGRR
ncbi:MAG TPA: cell division protein ZipA [Thioalkalivibrio sp.]|nr:cell division protein ZipA [Thioalkalivibrio sp.]